MVPGLNVTWKCLLCGRTGTTHIPYAPKNTDTFESVADEAIKAVVDSHHHTAPKCDAGPHQIKATKATRSNGPLV